MIDLEKLSPAPWGSGPGTDIPEDLAKDDFYWGGPTDWGAGSLIEHFRNGQGQESWDQLKTDIDFIALARNAFDVMMRRGWYPIPYFGKWRAHGADGYMGDKFPDPFTALVETDKWYKENVEKK